MNFNNQTFTGETIHLDNNVFEACLFVDCQIVYSGGLTGLSHNNFSNSKFLFEGQAGQTIKFLAAMYQGGAKELIERIISGIRGDVSFEGDILDAGLIN